MIGLLTGKLGLYLAGILAALLVAFGVAYWLQSIALSSCKGDVKLIQIEVDRLASEKARLLVAVKDQNDAIEKLKLVAIEKGRAADDALARAREASAKYEASRKRLSALLAAPVPAGAGCKEGVAAVRKELK